MVLIIGNGESRKSTNLDNIPIKKIGCNAVYRDNFIDLLVCVDRRMVIEALENNIQGLIYTRSIWIPQFHNAENVKSLPTLPFPINSNADKEINWSSGPYSILLGAMHFNIIYLIGFDLYSPTNFINNIYKNTKNYNTSNSKAVDPRYWIYQIALIFSHFKNNKFIIFQPNGWQQPKSWKSKNVFVDNIDKIKYYI